jgi:hypothetical protein
VLRARFAQGCCRPELREYEPVLAACASAWSAQGCCRPELREYEPVLAAQSLRCAPYRTPAAPHAISPSRNGSDGCCRELGDVAGSAQGSPGLFALANDGVRSNALVCRRFFPFVIRPESREPAGANLGLLRQHVPGLAPTLVRASSSANSRAELRECDTERSGGFAQRAPARTPAAPAGHRPEQTLRRGLCAMDERGRDR